MALFCQYWIFLIENLDEFFRIFSNVVLPHTEKIREFPLPNKLQHFLFMQSWKTVKLVEDKVCFQNILLGYIDMLTNISLLSTQL